MIEMKMLGLLLFGLVVSSAAAGSGSCLGRCGELFIRGQQCTCDFSCLQHGECCPDFEATCTSVQSCQGRCGESFKRGQLCECDPVCIRFNTCCHDYQQYCDATVTISHPGSTQSRMATVSRNQKNRKSERSRKRSNSESEELYTGGTLHFPSPDPPLPSHSGLTLGSSVSVSPSTPGPAVGKLKFQRIASPEGVSPSEPIHGVSGHKGFRPSTLQDIGQTVGLPAGLPAGLPVGLPVGEGGSERLETGFLADLCSDSPLNGLTVLSNGTILIFKGELFWSIDPASHSVGRPQNITDTLGVSSPIDAVFTRSDCNRNIYIIKGDQLWSLGVNLMLEPGYPKPLASEFPGLTGSISAALAVPASRSTPEMVYFFKSGDIMQKFTFPPSSTPSCRGKPRSPLKKMSDPQTDVLLSGEINIKVSLNGFPTPITSALSMPSPQGSDGYQYFVFSGPLFFRVQISGDLPALAKPDPNAAFSPLPIYNPAAVAAYSANAAGQSPDSPYPANSIRFWLRCP